MTRETAKHSRDTHPMFNRYSSRRQRLDASFLNARLEGARSYDRIAGYFSSSIIEVIGEALEEIAGKIRVICNSGVQKEDVSVAKAAQAAIRREWCDSLPELLGEAAKPRFVRLYELLRSKKMEVRVLPDEVFGLVHGKAGVITRANGHRTAFLGSANESKTALRLNYELVWEDDSDETVTWVQEEFDALWKSPFAVQLADFVIEDLRRLSQREVIEDVEQWREEPEPASAVVESPVYRKEVGLWEHQKQFVKLAFDEHRGPHGARCVLADQVGLGKTLQLAMAAQLMALVGDKPILVLAPKTLLQQWQDELHALLGLPSAIWRGTHWSDEHGIEHPAKGEDGIRACPRRIGIVSAGLVTSGSESVVWLENMRFECVIVDEAHRARRRKINSRNPYEKGQPNNLLRFIRTISRRTRSLLLATATPVQLHPIEAYDLLDALAQGSDAVLGGPGSPWRNAKASLPLLLGEAEALDDLHEQWEWLRNPLPPASEGREFAILRKSMGLPDEAAYAPGRAIDKLRAPDKRRIETGFRRLKEHHHPYIRRIIVRTREYLESTIDPETGEPYLARVGVRLHGESEAESIRLPPFLDDAYALAERFCELLRRRPGSGFFRTMLLRRMGSTMEAGRRTAAKILEGWKDVDESEDEEEISAEFRTLTGEERSVLERLEQAMEANQERDPKYAVVRELLIEREWLALGCIVFSQYFDSVEWLAHQLMGDLGDEPIGIYAGSNRSGVMRKGTFTRCSRDALKDAVRRRTIRLLLGTDAASEGLNLQRLGTLINLDLPWNPSRLEQRKGRIQRIGQVRPEVDIYNMRYAGSVEDRVHELLSERLEGISRLFGQVPDTLEDVWIQVALGEVEEAKRTIDAIPTRHPFALRYHEVKRMDWESCHRVLSDEAKHRCLSLGWTVR